MPMWSGRAFVNDLAITLTSDVAVSVVQLTLVMASRSDARYRPSMPSNWPGSSPTRTSSSAKPPAIFLGTGVFADALNDAIHGILT